jgi:hypothetical protein
MKKVRFGLVTSFQAKDMQRLYCILQGLGQVHFVAPDERDAKYDVIVLPSGGITPNLRCFTNGDYQGIPFSPICPLVDRFREQSLPFYKDADISIVGIGDSACILWDLLDQKVAVTSYGNMMLSPRENSDIEILGKTDGFVSGFSKYNDETSIIAGFDEPATRFTNTLLNLRNAILASVEEANKENRKDTSHEDEVYFV